MYSAEISIAGINPTVEQEIEALQTDFIETIQLNCKPVLLGSFATYTTDGTMPLAGSSRLNNTLSMDSSTYLRVAVFNAEGQRTGYYSNKFRKTPIALKIKGDYSLPANVNVMNHPSIIIKEPVTVDILVHKANKGRVRFKMNEKDSQGALQIYKEDTPVVIDKNCTLEVIIEDSAGTPVERTLLYVRRIE